MGTDMDNNKYKKIFYIIMLLYIICITGTAMAVFILSGSTLINNNMCTWHDDVMYYFVYNAYSR